MWCCWRSIHAVCSRDRAGFSSPIRKVGPAVGWQAWVLGTLLAVLTAPVLRAQAPADHFEELRARIAALEAQNAELRQAVMQRLPQTDPAAAPTWDTTHTANTWDHATLHSAIEQYLAEREAAGELAGEEDGGYEIGTDLSLTARWNHGLELSSRNKDFRVHIGGRTQFDTSWFSTPANVQQNINIPYQDAVDFRRARLRIDGTMYEVIDWAVEYDFVNAIRLRNAADTGTTDVDVTAFTDVWWTFKELPLIGNLRIGQQKEQIGFEHIVSSRFFAVPRTFVQPGRFLRRQL